MIKGLLYSIFIHLVLYYILIYSPQEKIKPQELSKILIRVGNLGYGNPSGELILKKKEEIKPLKNKENVNKDHKILSKKEIQNPKKKKVEKKEETKKEEVKKEEVKKEEVKKEEVKKEIIPEKTKEVKKEDKKLEEKPREDKKDLKKEEVKKEEVKKEEVKKEIIPEKPKEQKDLEKKIEEVSKDEVADIINNIENKVNAEAQALQAQMGHLEEQMELSGMSRRSIYIIESQLRNCYRKAKINDIENMPVKVKLLISRSGRIESNLDKLIEFGIYKTTTTNEKNKIESVKRALNNCNPLRNLPREDYNLWKEIIIEFE